MDGAAFARADLGVPSGVESSQIGRSLMRGDRVKNVAWEAKLRFFLFAVYSADGGCHRRTT